MNISSLALTTIHALREQAVSAVVQAMYARHPGLEQRLGQRGIEACREDIHYHLDSLEGALVAGEAALFTRYAIWLQEVLNRRNVPSGLLVESFDLLGDFLGRHLAAADAASVNAIIRAACDALTQNNPPSLASLSPSPSSPCARTSDLPEITQYMEAALQGNEKTAQEVMHRLMSMGHTLTEASVCLIQPASYEVGRLWQQNRITVAQEHLMTAVSQNVLARAYVEADFAEPNGSKALFACVAGNYHSLGLRMISDAFETVGWDTVFLGADVPVNDLIRQVDTDKPDFICLSLCLPVHLAVARDTVERLRAELGSRCPAIWVGGSVTLIADRIWSAVNADGWAADALHAIEQVTT